MVAFYILTFTR